jgi:hypothetical protein
MNLNEFNNLYRYLSVKVKVNVTCICGQTNNIFKEKALENINNNDVYLCMSCSKKEHYKINPRNEECNQKISESLKGIERSEETRAKMSQSKKEFYKTERGIELKEFLSRKATLEHSEGRLKGFHRKGYFKSAKNNKPIYYGSSYELRALYILENDPSVVSFETQISIQINGRSRCLDIIVKYENGSKEIFEVKPQERLGEEKVVLQLKDADDYATQNNCKFKVWTEVDSGFKNYREILLWAEQFIFNQDDIDLKSIRLEKDCIKAKKHYENNAKNDRITVFCKHCKKEHTLARKQYNNNVKKNGRFICIVENGHLIGGRTKDYLIKDNPYADQGMKQCANCKEIKPFSEFGNDKSRRDGYASRCKVCRNKGQVNV